MQLIFKVQKSDTLKISAYSECSSFGASFRKLQILLDLKLIKLGKYGVQHDWWIV